ncbi:MAG: hypothetical protein PF447_10360, partial [Spirochaetaceae bacterium]|nr:hypothetical protein [Spirochaetaceae bacterium]
MRLDLWLGPGELLGMGQLEICSSKGHGALLMALAINRQVSLTIHGEPLAYSLVLIDSMVPYDIKAGEDWQFFAYIPKETRLGVLLKEALNGQNHLGFQRNLEKGSWNSSFLSREFRHEDLWDLFHQLLSHFFSIQNYSLHWNGDLKKILEEGCGGKSTSCTIEQVAKGLNNVGPVIQREFFRITGTPLVNYLLHLKISLAFDMIKRNINPHKACLDAGISSYESLSQYMDQNFDWDIGILLQEIPTLSFNIANLKDIVSYLK